MTRDVHDLLGHPLIVVSPQLQLAEHLFDSDLERAQAEPARIRIFLGEAREELQRNATDHRGRTTEEELDGVRGVLLSDSLEVAVTGDSGETTEPIELVLGWVLREAATSMLRHAYITRVEISSAPSRSPVANDDDGYAGGEGNGSTGVRERIAAAGDGLRCGAPSLEGFGVVVMW